ncbi:sigma-70 family RNA polymerase sigma factor [Mesorhizobium sp. M0045]|uniref:sigma-70 family RNA polymerase sigma factor n=1 Tax=Mesorhizobium sp. M0045 TaxID=2956857 RepID=UPI00333BF095
MDPDEWLAERFEADRTRLRKVAYRLLGSSTEADDAVQEAWLRLSRSDARSVDNLTAWLTTVVARVCLDMLRARKSRAETLQALSEWGADSGDAADLDKELAIADSVGLALSVVLEKLAPAERVAFVLHDVFDVPFEEIAPIVGRTPVMARQLASRARRRIRGQPTVSAAELNGRRRLVDEFLNAVRSGNIDAIVALLDPDVVIRVDSSAAPDGRAVEAHGSTTVARGALAFAARTQFATPMLLNGAPGIVVAPTGRARYALTIDAAGEKIRAIEVIGDPARLSQIDFATLNSPD